MSAARATLLAVLVASCTASPPDPSPPPAAPPDVIAPQLEPAAPSVGAKTPSADELAVSDDPEPEPETKPAPGCPPSLDGILVTPDEGPMPPHVRCPAALHARFVSQTITHYRRDGERWEREYDERREYSERGDLLVHSYSGGSRPLPRTTYTYSSPHQLVRMQYRAGKDRQVREYRHEFDAGRLTRTIMTNPADRVEYISSYRYEANGDYQIRMSRRHPGDRDGDGATYPNGSERYSGRGLQLRDCGLNTCMMYEYDERGLPRRVREQYSNGRHGYRHWEHKLDADGRVIERVHGGTRIVREHDERGLVREELEFLGEELRQRRVYRHELRDATARSSAPERP